MSRIEVILTVILVVLVVVVIATARFVLNNSAQMALLTVPSSSTENATSSAFEPVGTSSTAFNTPPAVAVAVEAPGQAVSVATTSSPREAAVAQVATLAGWSPFTNEQYGISAQYPDNWYSYDALPLGGSAEFGSVPESETDSQGSLPAGSAEIMVYRSPETLNQAFSEDSLGTIVGSTATTTVDGTPALEVSYTFSSGNIDEQDLITYVIRGGYVYRIILRYRGESQFLNVFDEFLSTFQFI